MFDSAVLNGKIYLNGTFVESNLYINNGKISAISNELFNSANNYDAAGKYVLPGFIDPHVHFALTVGANTSVDDFRSGSISAAFGGVTTFIDFLDPVKEAEKIPEELEKRKKLAENSVIDYSFHVTIANPVSEPHKIIDYAENLKLPTIKLFTTYSNSDRRTYDDYIYKLLSLTKDSKTMILAHVENDDIVNTDKNIPVKNHGNARPEISEICEVIKLAEMVKDTGGNLYIVHTNCGTTIERITISYQDIKNKNLFIESCPHYFYFNSDVYNDEKGFLYTMTPPLRRESERLKLINFIDDINVIATDHCPFNSDSKNKEFTSMIPMGIGGVENSFVLMHTLFGDKIIDKYTLNPAKIHGLYPQKGTLMPRSDADIVIFDQNYDGKITNHHSKADYNLYEGSAARGKIVSVFSHGRLIIDNEQFIDNKGCFLERELKFL